MLVSQAKGRELVLRGVALHQQDATDQEGSQKRSPQTLAEIHWNPSGKAREVSVKLQNLVYFHAPLFTFIMFILPLMTGHLFWKATILGGLYRGVPLYMYTEHGYYISLKNGFLLPKY